MRTKKMKKDKIVGWESPVAIHPGEFLQDFIDEYNITQAELALRIGMSKKVINEIIKGKNPITETVAIKLSKVSPLSVEYWLNLQAGYEADLARLNQNCELESDVEHLDDFKCAYKELSKVKKLSNKMWVKKNYTAIILELQQYFGVSSLVFLPKAMDFAFRQYNRNNIDHFSLAAWLRLGKNKAQKTKVDLFDEKKLLKKLNVIKSFSTKEKEEYLPLLEKVFAECGIVFVYAPYFKNTHIQAATTWVSPKKALLMVATSKKGKDEGKFWFSIFHEIGHLLLHSKKDFHVDLKGMSSQKEREADNFAQKVLISNFSDAMADTFKYENIVEGIINIAEKNNISPAILAGRITHEYGSSNKNIYAMMSQLLKVRITESNI